MKLTIPCVNCGILVERYPSHVKDSGVVFCGRSCHAAASQLDAAAIVRLYTDEHLTIPQIAERLNVSMAGVWGVLERAGVPRRWNIISASVRERAKLAHPRGDTHPSFRALPIDRIISAYESGFAADQIADLFDCNPVTIVRKLREAGIAIRKPGFGRFRTASDGHRVQSGWELLVDEWLTANGIVHQTQVRLPFISRVSQRADFLAGGRYIEVWGVFHHPTYDTYRAKKIENYARCGLKLIEVRPADLESGKMEVLRVLL